MFKRTNQPQVFEPANPEYALGSSLSAEFIKAQSPLVYWWSVNLGKTVQSQDELDSIYGERGSGDRKFSFFKPNRVYLLLEQNPIMIELTRLGVEQIEEITCVINVDDFLNRNHADPKTGDVFRISYIKKPKEYRNVFYTVGSVVPFDIFNMRFMSWHLYAEQTPMVEIPDEITNFVNYL